MAELKAKSHKKSVIPLPHIERTPNQPVMFLKFGKKSNYKSQNVFIDNGRISFEK